MSRKSFLTVLVATAIVGTLLGGLVAGWIGFGNASGSKTAPISTPAATAPAGRAESASQSPTTTQIAMGTQTAGQPDAGGQTGRFRRLGGILGTIAKVSASAMTLTTAQSEITVSLSPATRVQEVGQNADGTQRSTRTLADLKVGVQVVVIGQAGADGVVMARIVAITPAGVIGQALGQGFGGPGASGTPGPGGRPSGGPRPTS